MSDSFVILSAGKVWKVSILHTGKFQEVLGLALLGLTLLVYLSLLSLNPLDPSLNVSAPYNGYQNWIGRAGAFTADSLFQAFGLAALVLPLPLLIVGFKKLRKRQIDYPYVKAVGFLGVILSLSSALNLSESLGKLTDSFVAGGAVGVVLASGLSAWLNPVGSAIASVTLLLLSLTLTTRFSIDALLDWVLSKPPIPFPQIGLRWRRWKERRHERQAANEIRRSDRKVVAQPVPSRDLALGGTKTFQSESPSNRQVQGRQPDVPPIRQEIRIPAGGQALQELEPFDSLDEPVFELPTLDFLQEAVQVTAYDEKELLEKSGKLTEKCAEFGVLGQVNHIHPGPVVTTYEFRPDPGVKYARITSLSDDLCLALKAEAIRIDRVPGKNTVGIEVPNSKRRIIYLKEVLASTEFRGAPSRLTLGLGQLINGDTFVADLGRMPHLLIAGSTGTGKSVGLNCMLCSILYKASPKEVRFILVDPKRLELGLYEDVPHLLTPIVTDPKKAANALNWAVREMEDRYRLLAQQGVRNIAQYNAVIRESRTADEGDELGPIPNIVIIVDELADLMMTAGKEVEVAVTRLAQMARAVGIHLILATQRPSVDVITGLIKANFPCRISFRVSSKIDSRTILDSNGAEQLLGMGDMLYLSPESSRLIRIHGAFVSEKEIARIVRYLKDQAEPDYREEVLLGEEDEEGDIAVIDTSDLEDKLFPEAARFVVETRKASTSLLQRRFRIGYGRAARLLDIMEHEGIVGPPDGSRPREILVPHDYFAEVGGP